MPEMQSFTESYDVMHRDETGPVGMTYQKRASEGQQRSRRALGVVLDFVMILLVLLQSLAGGPGQPHSARGRM